MAAAALVLSATAAAPPPFDKFNTTLLDCEMRRLLWKRAQEAQPWLNPRLTFDSLELETLCGDAAPPSRPASPPKYPISTQGPVWYVATDGDDTGGDGSLARPYASLGKALDVSRGVDPAPRTIALRGGIYHIGTTAELGPRDANLTIQSYPGERAWLSGGIPLLSGPNPPAWMRSPLHDASLDVWAVNLSGTGVIESLGKTGAAEIPGLFTRSPHRRLTRARFPNGDAETSQWGYSSKYRYNYSIPAAAVAEWTRPPVGKSPSMTFVDLRSSSNPSGVAKNDSEMTGYNTFATGQGGVCATVWGQGESYWCSNGSAGGWAEVDAEAAVTGQLGIPVGMRYDPQYTTNVSEGIPLGRRWAEKDLAGAIVHAWHSQSWAMHMFEVEKHDPKADILRFKPGGGMQGGRNWCRCDQCTYAGPWCGQHATPPDNNDTRLISGSWFVENVISELDDKGEWFYDPAKTMLYLRPNRTGTPPLPPPQFAPGELIATRLDTIVSVRGEGRDSWARGITLRGLGFRDSAATFMRYGEWSAPSGGDWALRRGGALFLEGAEGVTIEGCSFTRLDGNALFLSGYTRDVVIRKNDFSWIGEGAMATWGRTDRYDATGGEQPRRTRVVDNVVREIGLYEKQSSAWGQAKAALSHLENNIFFNMPRAAINFNDNLGGGNNISRNLIWNTCRESGDHGPINTWDRMPFLTRLRGGVPSFEPLPTRIDRNFIIANYGGSQGVDNDDGSSWYRIENNVFHGADGFKMDYGGHDSSFSGNLVVVYPYDGQNCFNVGGFYPGHAHSYFNNTCVSGAGAYGQGSGCGSPACASTSEPARDMDSVGHASNCDSGVDGHFVSHDNTYFSPHGNATITCGRTPVSIPEAQKKFDFERRSTFGPLPAVEAIVRLAESILAE